MSAHLFNASFFVFCTFDTFSGPFSINVFLLTSCHVPSSTSPNCLVGMHQTHGTIMMSVSFSNLHITLNESDLEYGVTNQHHSRQRVWGSHVIMIKWGLLTLAQIKSQQSSYQNWPQINRYWYSIDLPIYHNTDNHNTISIHIISVSIYQSIGTDSDAKYWCTLNNVKFVTSLMFNLQSITA